ncbi:DUF3445 domain-containing protein [Stieleria sp. JC731]|uniref:heme-dependent oxidative N-demethylase subunit alpha family protein n=1 Tax=Pirellulaceae TaxID=2691357 RepID=UPI001E39D32E|nr:heme-dependent oxidative N-demethylase subunit alpha family protein [Stieleria sp. JC731]MCC9603181.1 DUF3445 domain-containing protein [Stieleria sp. JC731]
MIEIFPLKRSTFEHQFGIAALTPDQAIFGTNANYLDEIAQRNRLIGGPHRDDYFIDIDHESIDPILKWAIDRSDHLQQTDSLLVNSFTGSTQSVSHDASPCVRWEWLHKNIQEDLVVLSPRDAFETLGGCVCFPSGWSLLEKQGKPLLDVHRDVPDFKTALWNPTEKLFRRLKPGKTVWRSNWGIRPSDALDQSPRHSKMLSQSRDAINVQNALDRCYFRVEFQTLTSVPISDNANLRESESRVVFTIRTTQSQLCQLSTSQLQTLLGVIETCPAETLRYKGIEPMADAIKTAIEKRLNQPSDAEPL